MCCLRYEAEAYKDFNKRAPRKGSIVDTPRGGGKVVELDALRETVKLQFRSDTDDRPGDVMKVGIQHLCCAKKGADGAKSCPCSIAPDVFEELEEEEQRAKTPAGLAGVGDFDYKALTSTQGTDAAIDNGEREGGAPGAESEGSAANKGARNSNKGASGDSSDGSRKRGGRRRRGGRRGGGAKEQGEGAGSDGQARQGGRQNQGQQQKPSQRPKKKNQQRGKKSQQQQGKPRQEQQKQATVETRIPRRRNRG